MVNKIKIAVLIPAYNEEKTIGWVCENIPRIYKDIIVINDGSKDNTAIIAKKHGAIVIEHRYNQGYGHALNTGFRYVKNRYDIVVTIDADAQHDPKELIRLLKPIYKGYDVVFGIRRPTFGKMPLWRLIGMNLISITLELLFRKNIPLDTQCGYRAYKTHVFNKIQLKERSMPLGLEILLQIIKHGYKIKYVPVSLKYNEHKSYYRLIRDTYKMFRMIINQKITFKRKHNY